MSSQTGICFENLLFVIGVLLYVLGFIECIAVYLNVLFVYQEPLNLTGHCFDVKIKPNTQSNTLDKT